MSNDPFAVPPPQPPAASGGPSVALIIAIVLGVFLVLALLCGGVLVALLLPAVSAARNAAQTAMSTNQLKQVGLAVHNYHSAYRELPPAFVTDSSGNPMWSWRVSLLPFLEEQGRWEQWHQDQAWDSAANSPLNLPLPATYASPSDQDPTSDQTHVFAVRHPSGMMSGQPGLTFADTSDGLSNTILAVYLPDRTTSWSAPEDITLQELQTEFAKASPGKQVLVLLGDGSVIRFAEPLDPTAVEALVTRDAGDSADGAFVGGF